MRSSSGKRKTTKCICSTGSYKAGCNYPFKHLSGAGVALKLAIAVGTRIGKKELAFKYLDLVALAGAADIVH